MHISLNEHLKETVRDTILTVHISPFGCTFCCVGSWSWFPTWRASPVGRFPTPPTNEMHKRNGGNEVMRWKKEKHTKKQQSSNVFLAEFLRPFVMLLLHPSYAPRLCVCFARFRFSNHHHHYRQHQPSPTPSEAVKELKKEKERERRETFSFPTAPESGKCFDSKRNCVTNNDDDDDDAHLGLAQ